MYQVFNTLTNTPEAVLSETPYELAGPLAERRYEQKRDEQGNLLYLTTTEVVDTAKYYDENGNYIPATDPDEVLQTKTIEIETTEATWSETIAETWDENGNVLTTRVEVHQNPPVMIDAGPLYEWREIIPTLDDLRQSVLRNIDAWTRQAIIGGFVSSASGAPHRYDSEDNDQDNLKLMQAVAHSERFPVHPVYQGHIPIRAVPQGQSEKAVLYLDTEQMDLLLEDLALHIGACKVEGWRLQGKAAAAQTEKALNAIVWEGE